MDIRFISPSLIGTGLLMGKGSHKLEPRSASESNGMMGVV